MKLFKKRQYKRVLENKESINKDYLNLENK